MSSDELVQCDICGHWMMPWLVCDATEHCPYYDEGDVGP
jgi:ribosomal protein L32